MIPQPQPVAVERVMRSSVRLNGILGRGARVSDYDARRLADEAALQPRLPAPPPIDASTLPVIQQAALMQMHESAVKRAIIARLLEDSQDKPGTLDYRALSDLGLAYRNAGKRYHDLTGEGRTAAKTLEQKLCRDFDIHLMLGPTGSGLTVSFSCPCGWHQSFRNSHTAPGNARASWNRWHRTAEGMSKLLVALKPPVMAAEG